MRNKTKQANKVRRVDRQKNALPTDRSTDRPTDQPIIGYSQLYRCFVAPKKNIIFDDGKQDTMDQEKMKLTLDNSTSMRVFTLFDWIITERESEKENE